MNNLSIFIGSDHAGFQMKQDIINWLKEKNISYVDLGTDSNESVDYPIYALRVGKNVVVNPNSLGILICGTGFGMTIAANKIKGIRAINIVKKDMASLAVIHNNINVVCLSARFSTKEENLAILEEVFKSKFEGGRHSKRLAIINDYEVENEKKFNN